MITTIVNNITYRYDIPVYYYDAFIKSVAVYQQFFLGREGLKFYHDVLIIKKNYIYIYVYYYTYIRTINYIFFIVVWGWFRCIILTWESIKFR